MKSIFTIKDKLSQKSIHNLIFGKIYSIIEIGRVLNTIKKKESEYIF